MRLQVKTLPLVSLAIAAAAMAATFNPLAAQFMVYDRTAIIHGEAWRLVSGHLYHFSPSHLGSNLLPLIVVGAWIESQHQKWFAVGCLLIALTSGTSLFLVHPLMERYGGLSGVLCGLLVFFGFSLLFDNGGVRWIGLFTLAAMMIKIGYEWHSGGAGLIDWHAHGFVVMPLSHLSGMVAGAVWFLIQSASNRGWLSWGKPVNQGKRIEG